MDNERGSLAHGQLQAVPDLGAVALVAELAEGEQYALGIAFAQNPAREQGWKIEHSIENQKKIYRKKMPICAMISEAPYCSNVYAWVK